MNILLVDDDYGSRSCVGEFLKELGYHVVECSNGQDALTEFKQGNFQMILSDIKMPKMSGLELLNKIKKSPYGQNVDMVLFTGYGDTDTAIDAINAGASGYLFKPINIEELALLTEKISQKHLKTF